MCHHFKITDGVKRALPHFLTHGDPSMRVPLKPTRDGGLMLLVKERDGADHGRLIEDCVCVCALWVDIVHYETPITEGYYARVLWNNSQEIEMSF